MANRLKNLEKAEEKKKEDFEELENERIRMILLVLPGEDELRWEKLTEWEQKFLPSVREQFEENGKLSEAQVEILERLWNKDI